MNVSCLENDILITCKRQVAVVSKKASVLEVVVCKVKMVVCKVKMADPIHRLLFSLWQLNSYAHPSDTCYMIYSF